MNLENRRGSHPGCELRGTTLDRRDTRGGTLLRLPTYRSEWGILQSHEGLRSRLTRAARGRSGNALALSDSVFEGWMEIGGDCAKPVSKRATPYPQRGRLNSVALPSLLRFTNLPSCVYAIRSSQSSCRTRPDAVDGSAEVRVRAEGFVGLHRGAAVCRMYG